MFEADGAQAPVQVFSVGGPCPQSPGGQATYAAQGPAAASSGGNAGVNLPAIIGAGACLEHMSGGFSAASPLCRQVLVAGLWRTLLHLLFASTGCACGMPSIGLATVVLY